MLVQFPSKEVRLAKHVVLEKLGHRAHHASQESFVLAVTTMPLRARLVLQESTNL